MEAHACAAVPFLDSKKHKYSGHGCWKRTDLRVDRLTVPHFTTIGDCAPTRLTASLQENAVKGDIGGSSIKVKFVLQKKCEFGQQFNVVGDDLRLGAWDPDAAIPMKWSEGHTWTTELDLSVGKRIEFKMILTGKQGEVEWQPGPNRVFETPEALSCLVISGSWAGEDIIESYALEDEIGRVTTRSDNSDDFVPPLDMCSSDSVGETPETASEAFLAEIPEDPDESNVEVKAVHIQDTEPEILTDNGPAQSSSEVKAVVIWDTEPEILIDNGPAQSSSEILKEDEALCRPSDNPSAGSKPKPKPSVLEKDLNWWQIALTKFWTRVNKGNPGAC